MTNYQSGHDAEKQAAEYLRKQKFKIRKLNWKTRYCEIDIVAEKKKVMWFVEVKSRRNVSQGRGYEYVTAKKLQQMQFAAEMWVQEAGWKDDYRLSVISIDGNEVTFIEEL
jgi:Holliday junction resolvase-like predicted endonuclease